MFKYLSLFPGLLTFRHTKVRGGRRVGQTFPSEEPGGIFVSLEQFLADLGVVVMTGFAESNIRFPWPTEY